jgi:DNA polymerase
MRLVGVDAAQIEARYNAYTAGEEALLQIFRDHGDPYSDLASKLYSRPVSKYGPNAHLRPVGKAMELGLGYGMGVEHFYWAARSGALGEPVAIEMDEAAAAVNLYRQVRPCIVEQWSILQGILALMKHAYQREDTKWRTQLGPWTFEPDRVLLPNGLYMHYRGIHSREGKRGERTVLDTVYFHGNDITRIWGSKLCENLIQATCRAIIAWQALTVARRYRIVLLVHDEIVFVVPAAEAEEALAWALDVLRTPPPWAPELPLDAEGHVGETYADLK